MGVADYLRAIYDANWTHNSNDPSVFIHGTVSTVISGLTATIGGGTVTAVISGGTVTVSAVLAGTVTANIAGGTMTVIPTVPQSNIATLTSVTGNASSVLFDATRAGRLGMIVVNDSTSTLFVKYGLTATTTGYSVIMPPVAYWEMPTPIYTGEIDGIWQAANAGAARVTILT